MLIKVERRYKYKRRERIKFLKSLLFHISFLLLHIIILFFFEWGATAHETLKNENDKTLADM